MQWLPHEDGGGRGGGWMKTGVFGNRDGSQISRACQDRGSNTEVAPENVSNISGTTTCETHPGENPNGTLLGFHGNLIANAMASGVYL